MNWSFKISMSLLAVWVGVTPVAHADTEDRHEGEDGNVASHQVRSEMGIVAADEANASRVAAEVLAAGGSAADAGVTALLMVGVTHPFASGLGGGGFCLYREQESERTTVLDFRERAPLRAHRDLYVIDGEGRPELARHGGLAVGVPGEAAGLWALHGRFGRLPWEEVVEPVRAFAAQGFEVGPTLGRHLASLEDTLQEWPELAAVFQNEAGEFLRAGDRMTREDLAKTLELLRDEGYRPFYVGEVAEAMIAAAEQAGGILSEEDFRIYEVIRRDPVRAVIGDYEVLSMPPPSSGGVALIQALQILSHFDREELDDAAWLHVQLEAIKHAFADRAEWLGDADFVDVPVERLIDPNYAAQLAARINLEQVLDPTEYGTVAPHDDPPGTAHLSVVDKEGNMLACTSTINTRFGSLVYVPEYGMILNNEMADFNTQPGQPNLYGLVGNEQNAVAPRKRPLSSMSPTLVLEDGEPTMTVGASGGPTIISGVYFTLIRMLLEGQTPMEAMMGPRYHHQWLPDVLFVDDDSLPVLEGIRARGHQLRVRPSFTAVQFIFRDGDEWVGVSDPRKGGIPASSEVGADTRGGGEARQ